MGFDPKRHIMKLKGKDYLPIAARLVWFRDEHPDWGIVTTPVEINMEKQYAIFSASIFNGEGKLMATATKMENVAGFGDFIEKAETGSVGRALAYCGYGTQFAPELEEGSRFADAPYGGGGGNFNTSSNRFGQGNNNGGPRPAGNDGGNGNGYRQNGNNGGPRPANNDGGNNFQNGPYTNNAPRPNDGNGNRPMPAPAAQRPAPQAARRDDDFGGDDGEGDLEAPPARPAMAAARPAPVAPPTPAPTGNSGGVTRVREPEQDYGDPGGDDEEDEDPFADEEEAPVAAKPASVAARANGASQPGRPAPKAAPIMDDEGDDDGGPIAPPPATNKCSAEGCNTTLPPAVISMSTAKYGRPLCVVHQKEATPIIGGNVTVGAGAARPRAKVGAASGGDGGLL